MFSLDVFFRYWPFLIKLNSLNDYDLSQYCMSLSISSRYLSLLNQLSLSLIYSLLGTLQDLYIELHVAKGWRRDSCPSYVAKETKRANTWTSLYRLPMHYITIDSTNDIIRGLTIVGLSTSGLLLGCYPVFVAYK